MHFPLFLIHVTPYIIAFFGLQRSTLPVTPEPNTIVNSFESKAQGYAGILPDQHIL